MQYLAGSQMERTCQRVFVILPWRHDFFLAPLGPPRRPDFGQQRDSEFIRKDQPLMRLPVLGVPPNPGHALAPLWVVILRHQFGAFPHPAHLMEPASDGPRGHLQAVLRLELRRQRGPTPPRPAPALGTGWRLEESPQRARQPRPQDGRPGGGHELALSVDGEAQLLRTIEAHDTGDTGARAEQQGRKLGRMTACGTEESPMQREEISIAGSAERREPLVLLFLWDIQ